VVGGQKQPKGKNGEKRGKKDKKGMIAHGGASGIKVEFGNVSGGAVNSGNGGGDRRRGPRRSSERCRACPNSKHTQKKKKPKKKTPHGQTKNGLGGYDTGEKRHKT